MKKKFMIGLLMLTIAGSMTACGVENENIDRAEDPVVELGGGSESAIQDNAGLNDNADIENEDDISPEEEIISDKDDPTEEELTEDGKIFMSFLSGEMDAIFEEDFQSALQYVCIIHDYSSGNDSYTFDITDTLSFEQLLNSINESDSIFLDPEEVEKSYAVLNTVSGKQILAVKLQNLGIYDPGDDSYAVFLFAVNDGQLYMTYAYDSWARSTTGIYGDLIIAGGGSSGAGAHSAWYGTIDENGHYQSLCQMIIDSDYWVDGEWSEGCTFIYLTTPDGRYYWYEAEDSVDSEMLTAFIDQLEAEGMTEVDDVDRIIDVAFEAAGITYDPDMSEFGGWKILD